MFYFTLLLLFVVLGVLRKQSKIILICLYAILFFVSVNFTEGYDVSQYEKAYYLPTDDVEEFSKSKSIIFAAFMIFSNFILGIDFYHFRILCFLLWSIPIFLFVLRFAKGPTWVIALCSCFPILTFSSQIRNGLAVSLVYIAICSLFKESIKYGKLIFVLLIILASLVHNIAFVYILGLIALSNRFKSSFLLRICLIIAFSSWFILKSGILYGFVAMTMNDFYANQYFSQMDEFKTANFHLFVGIAINMWFSYKAQIFNHLYTTEYDGYLCQFARFVYRLNILLVAFVPLLFVSLSFYRIYQNVFILTAISVINSAYLKHSKRNDFLNLWNGYVLFYALLTYLYNLGQGTFIEYWSSIRI